LTATKKQRSKAKPKFRAVFDTNVYVAKTLSRNPRSPNIELFELLRVDAYLLIWCDEIRTDVATKLLAKGLTAQRIAEFITEVMSLALWVEVPHLLNLKSPFLGCVVVDSLHFLFLVRGNKPPLKARVRNWLRQLFSN
jgi:hypothetical protein